MISKNELKYIQSLYHKKTRDKEKLFIVEGPKMVAELLRSGFKTKKVWTTNENWQKTYPDAPIEMITAEELQRVSHLKTAHEIIALAEMTQKEVAGKVNTPHDPSPVSKLTLALDGIRDPGNMGTLIRIADWFGVDQLIASEDSADIFNPKVVQATMGSIFRTNVHYKDLTRYLAENKVPVYGALLNGMPLGSFPIPVPMTEGIILIGNESTGISPGLLPFITQAVKIPQFGQAESLNAAVAAAVLLGHLKIPSYRQ